MRKTRTKRLAWVRFTATPSSCDDGPQVVAKKVRPGMAWVVGRFRRLTKP